jgi:hypothetical protein
VRKINQRDIIDGVLFFNDVIEQDGLMKITLSGRKFTLV